MPPPTVLVIRKEKTESRKKILCMNTKVMDATSVMDPDPQDLHWFYSDFCCCVLVWESEAAPVAWSSFMEALGWYYEISDVLYVLVIKSLDPYPHLTNANPQHWLVPYACWWQNSKNGKILVFKRLLKVSKSEYVARDICIFLGILGAVSRWDSDHYLSSMYSWVTSYPTTAIVFLGNSSKMFSPMMSLIIFLKANSGLWYLIPLFYQGSL